MLKGVKLVLRRGHLRSQTGLHCGLAWFHLVAYMFNKFFFSNLSIRPIIVCFLAPCMFYYCFLYFLGLSMYICSDF